MIDVISLNQERMKGNRVNILKVIPLKLFLHMVSSPSTDNLTAHVAWMLLWRMKMYIKPLGLSTSKICATGAPRISEVGNDIKIT